MDVRDFICGAFTICDDSDRDNGCLKILVSVGEYSKTSYVVGIWQRGRATIDYANAIRIPSESIIKMELLPLKLLVRPSSAL